MVREKRFYLKIRKSKMRWGCPCCFPVGRDQGDKLWRNSKSKVIRSKDVTERRLFSKLIQEELDSELAN